MLNTIIKDRIIDTPWPVYIDGKLYNGTKFKVHSECTEDCIFDKHGSDINICTHGLTHISRKILDQLITVSGVYIQTGTLSKRYKKNTTYMQRKVSSDNIQSWFLNLDEKSLSIQALVTKTAKKNFEQFHEFVKWSGEIREYSERLLEKSAPPGTNAFEHASKDLKSLYKTSIMLMDSLDTTALYFNPQSAKFGRKKRTDIYRMIDKIKLILSHASSNKGRVNVQIKGNVVNEYKVYESFKIIPLSLIQNAIKYKRIGNVDILFEETDDKLLMSVISVGDEIPANELNNLFIRGFRTEKARKMSVEGSGLGL